MRNDGRLLLLADLSPLAADEFIRRREGWQVDR